MHDGLLWLLGGREDWNHWRRRKNRINLSGVSLARVNLSGYDLRGVNFEGANLRGAVLREACMDRGLLSGADLSRADLMGARLLRAQMFHSDCVGAVFDFADLSEAYLTVADMRDTTWVCACLAGADVEQTDFRGAEAMGLCVDNIKGAAWVPADPVWEPLRCNTIPSDLVGLA